MIKIENDIIHIDFPTIFNIVNNVMQTALRCGLSDDCLCDTEIHIPITSADNPYVDISFPHEYFNVKPT